MKKYCFTIASLLFLVIGLASCSNEENKTQSDTASRPSVPIMNSEVQIGTQIWMTKNLNVSRYRNGDPIPQVFSLEQWASLTTGAWRSYSNPALGLKYGKLYNWYAVNDPRGLAPVGWHIPSKAEWTTLITFLGGQGLAGGKMKAITGWAGPNTGATNSSGFTGLPAGIQEYETLWFEIDGLGTTTGLWSSTEDTSANMWYCSLNSASNAAFLTNSNGDIKDGLSVRCIKN